jgi:hypothetical protein
MNIKDLQPGSYKVVNSNTVNVKDLPAGAYKTVNTTAPAGPPDSNRNFVQKTAGFLGIEKAGQGLATAGRVANGAVNQTGDEEAAALGQLDNILKSTKPGSPERKRLMDQYNRVYRGGVDTQAQIDPGTKLSNREVIGSFGNVALNVLTPGAFKGGLAKQALKNAGLGAGYGLAGGLYDNKKGLDLLEATEAGAGIGAALPIAGKLLSATTQKVFPKLAQGLEEKSLRLTPVQKQNLGKDLNEITDYITSKNIIGTPEKRYAKISQLYEGTETKLQNWLSAQKIVVNKEQVISKLEGLKAAYSSGAHPDERDLFAIERQIDGVIDLLKAKYPDAVPLERLNNLKRSTYKNAYNKAGDKVLDTVEHDIGDVFRTTIEESTKGKTIGLQNINQFNKEYGKLIKARKLLRIAQTRPQIGLVGKLVSAGIGAGIGNTLGSLVGGAVGAAAGPKVGEMVAGTATRSLVGAGFKKASNAGSTKAGQLVKQVTKRAILNSQ